MTDVRAQYAYLKPQPVVWLAILGSFVVHLGLVGLLVIGGILQERHVPLKDRAIITRLVKKGKKMPDNWLPHKDVQPPPAQPPAPRAVAPNPEPAQPKPQPPKPAAPSKQDYSKDMRSALANLEKEFKKTQYEQMGDPDGVDDGEALIKQKGDEYLTQVYKAIKARYEVPELISPKERMFLRAEVILYLDASGQIRELRFAASSQNQLFDSAVESAIRRAAPFPAPPKELADQYAREGIQVPFRASKM
jgi:TonB family protein